MASDIEDAKNESNKSNNDNEDFERERMLNFIKVVSFIFLAVVIWYASGIADGL